MGARNPLNPLIRVGLVFLILASLSRWLFHPKTTSGHDLTDAVTGLLYGLAIGCMLFGILRQRKGPAEPPAQA
jgi:hypothetical protein